MITRFEKLSPDNPDERILEEAGRILRNGGLAAFPTETVYGLGGNALDSCAARRIYAAKGRPSDNPLIVHIAEISAMEAIASEIPEGAKILAEKCWPGPLTMIFRKKDIVPYETTGGLDTVAVRFPANRIACGLIRHAGGYVAAPSANLSGRPSPVTAQHVLDDLDGRIDMILDGGRVRIGLESTIVDFTEEVPVILRPGYYNQSFLASILGDVRVDPGIMEENENVRPKAPGMRYRHYAPKGELTIVEGPRESVPSAIAKLVRSRLAEGKKAGVICTEETRACYRDGIIYTIGELSEEETIAAHLYEVLRAFDAEGVDYIYSESFYTPRMGQAIMNRLLKAAGHRVIKL